VRDHDHLATTPKPSQDKNQTEKRSPAWRQVVHAEALAALKRCRERERDAAARAAAHALRAQRKAGERVS
jgi:hypothetical protein